MTKVIGNTEKSTMDTFYTLENFLRVSLSASLLLILIPHSIIGTRARLMSMLLSIVLVINALVPLVPRNFDRTACTVLSVILIGPLLYWTLFIVNDFKRPNLERYQNWIIDTLRESVLIFDDKLRLQGYRGNIADLSEVASRFLVSEMRNIVIQNTRNLTEGFIKYEALVYRYRIRSVQKGYLVTLLDFSEEQQLLDEVMAKNRILEQRRSLLMNRDSLSLIAYKEKYKQNVTIHIQHIVKKNLNRLRTMIAEKKDPETLLYSAEEALSGIRYAVGRLVGNEEKK